MYVYLLLLHVLTTGLIWLKFGIKINTLATFIPKTPVFV